MNPLKTNWGKLTHLLAPLWACSHELPRKRRLVPAYRSDRGRDKFFLSYLRGRSRDIRKIAPPVAAYPAWQLHRIFQILIAPSLFCWTSPWERKNTPVWIQIDPSRVPILWAQLFGIISAWEKKPLDSKPTSSTSGFSARVFIRSSVRPTVKLPLRGPRASGGREGVARAALPSCGYGSSTLGILK